MKTLLTLILMSILAIFSFNTQASSAEAGQKLYTSKKINCAQCHKKDGMGAAKRKVDGSYKLSMTKGPRISGLPIEVIKKALTQIQDKSKKKLRKTKYSSMMKSRIKKLSADDIESLAKYISKVLNPGAGEYKSEVWPRK